MESQDIVKNLQLFKESTGRTLILSEIDKHIKEYTDVLTGDSIPDTVNEEMNKTKYTGHDLARIARANWIELKEIPDRLITQHDPITIVKPQA